VVFCKKIYFLHFSLDPIPKKHDIIPQRIDVNLIGLGRSVHDQRSNFTGIDWFKSIVSISRAPSRGSAGNEKHPDHQHAEINNKPDAALFLQFSFKAAAGGKYCIGEGACDETERHPFIRRGMQSLTSSTMNCIFY
jgi:hypothetical protein